MEKKKGKSKIVKVDPEDEDEQEDPRKQEVMKVEMLVAEPALDDMMVEEETSARMKLAGKLLLQFIFHQVKNLCFGVVVAE